MCVSLSSLRSVGNGKKDFRKPPRTLASTVSGNSTETTKSLNKRTLKKNLFLFLTLITLFASCNGQKTIGKSVNEQGKHLWYVFQDTKNNYWFSSNGEGVYLYDGKKIINFTTKDGLANDTIRQIQVDKLGNIYIITFRTEKIYTI